VSRRTSYDGPNRTNAGNHTVTLVSGGQVVKEFANAHSLSMDGDFVDFTSETGARVHTNVPFIIESVQRVKP
jgi:hypothetical protein